MVIRLLRDEDFAQWLLDWSGLFEWDEGNIEKLKKHSFTTAEVEALFESKMVLQGLIEQPEGAFWSEPRHLITLRSLTTSKCFSAIVTRRGEFLRVISCRRSRPDEEKRHHEEY